MPDRPTAPRRAPVSDAPVALLAVVALLVGLLVGPLGGVVGGLPVGDSRSPAGAPASSSAAVEADPATAQVDPVPGDVVTGDDQPEARHTGALRGPAPEHCPVSGCAVAAWSPPVRAPTSAPD